LLSLKSPIRQGAGNQIWTHPLESIIVAEQLKRLLMDGPPLRTRRGERYKTHLDAPYQYCTIRALLAWHSADPLPYQTSFQFPSQSIQQGSLYPCYLKYTLKMLIFQTARLLDIEKLL
jgi:hypothetical protein